MKNKKNKNIYLYISIFIVILVVVLLLNLKNISKLFGTVSKSSSDRYSETISEICNTIADNDYFMTISFGIYQNYGPSGDATVILESVDKKFIFEKNIKVDSGSRANFSYAVPRGKYTLTIVKEMDEDGVQGNDFDTYNHKNIIDENTNYFTLELKHSDRKNLIVSGHLFNDIYYDYIRNDNKKGTIRVYKKEEAEYNLEKEKYSYTILGKVVKDMLKKHNIKFEFGEGKYTDLGAVLVDIFMASILSESRLISTDSLSVRDTFKLQLEMYKSGVCGTISECFGMDSDDGVKNAFGSDENFADAFTLLLDDEKLPVNNKIVIEEGVELLESGLFYAAKTDKLVIPSTVVYIGSGALAGADISKLEFNGYKSDLDYGSGSILEGAYVENIVFAEGIERIGENLFSNIDSPVSLNFPSTLKIIENDCFRETKIVNGYIDLKNIEKVGDNAFNNSGLKNINFGNKLKEIGKNAFYNNEIQITSISSAYSNYPTTYDYLLIPKTVNKIGEYAFYSNNINQLKFAVDSSNQLSDIEYIGKYAFEGNKIVEVIIPNNELNNIVIDSYAFDNNKIVYVDLNKSVKEVNEGAFSNNIIKKVKLSESLKSLGKNSFYKNEIISIDFNDSLEEIGESAFENNKIVDLVLPESLKKIGIRAFSINSIVNLKIPKNVEYIYGDAFLNNNLKTLEFLVDADTKMCSLKSIGSFAFEGNDEKTTNVLEELYLPKSNSSNGYTLGYRSFYNNKIKKITLSESVVLDNAQIFSSNDIELVKVLGEDKNRYYSVWQSAGLPAELKIY